MAVPYPDECRRVKQARKEADTGRVIDGEFRVVEEHADRPRQPDAPKGAEKYAIDTPAKTVL